MVLWSELAWKRTQKLLYFWEIKQSRWRTHKRVSVKASPGMFHLRFFYSFNIYSLWKCFFFFFWSVNIVYSLCIDQEPLGLVDPFTFLFTTSPKWIRIQINLPDISWQFSNNQCSICFLIKMTGVMLSSILLLNSQTILWTIQEVPLVYSWVSWPPV